MAIRPKTERRHLSFLDNTLGKWLNCFFVGSHLARWFLGPFFSFFGPFSDTKKLSIWFGSLIVNLAFGV